MENRTSPAWCSRHAVVYLQSCAQRAPVIARDRRNVDLLKEAGIQNLAIQDGVLKHTTGQAKIMGPGFFAEELQQVKNHTLGDALQTCSEIKVGLFKRLVRCARCKAENSV